MEILTSLGVNDTLWIQLACFIVSYLVFSNLILKPYSAALKEREKRTVGNEETAVRLVEEANDLHTEYEKKARSLNSEIKQYFDKSRSEATKEYATTVESARSEATTLLDASRGRIAQEIQSARGVLASEVPAVSATIASKLAGKEISL